MLYPKSKIQTLDMDLFKNPTSEYRGTPFWAWNCKLDKELLETQIECLKGMGFGGFHMHSRTGMATKYLGDEFMSLVKVCLEKAKQENMFAWLYDEDRWPSGAAGGLVTADPRYRMRSLVFMQNEIDNCVPEKTAIETGEPCRIACYDIVLNEAGELASYDRIDAAAEARGEKWFAYVLAECPTAWFNNQTYVDTLNKAAIDKFIEVTYERYKSAVGESFGTTIPAIFTDEPAFKMPFTLKLAADKTAVTLPWTHDIVKTYQDDYQEDILDTLPELIWELPNGRISRARYLFYNHITDRFTGAFAENCGSWCEKNHIALTGHVQGEQALSSQTVSVGEAMRSYRSFQLPGVDMLCDHTEFITVKQAQSAARQYGREGVLSELYGVTNWDFDFRGHKFQGDWQAALGVTVRVPHLSWVSMAGEAKRDYPASINYQSPWYKEYPYVEDHFARLNTVLTRGIPVVKVGVVHPIESYWLHRGPEESTSAIRKQMDQDFESITEWLLFGQIDFDYISEALLPELCVKASSPFPVGKMQYDVIVVPACETLRQTTLDRLTAFRNDGGHLIFMGDCPRYIDAVLSDGAVSLYKNSQVIKFNRNSLLAALNGERVIEIRGENGALTDNLIYTMREDHECKWLFIAHGVKNRHPDVTTPQNLAIKLKGEYTPVLYDTLTGETAEIDYTLEKGHTLIHTMLYCHDSLLLRLERCRNKAEAPASVCKKQTAEIRFMNKVPYTRSEPNVLLLDTAQYALDGGRFYEEEEILKADDALREILGWPSRRVRPAQPWSFEPEPITHEVTLKFVIHSKVRVERPVLAIEDAESLVILLNGRPVKNTVTGYYVDHSIKTVSLPALECGENELIIKIPFGKTTNLEACYILGDFNVNVEGCVKTITPSTDRIAFSSITHQGLPFYGGNLQYRVDVQTNNCDLVIKANHYRGALISVAIDGEKAGVIAYAPYTLVVKNVKAGKHVIGFTLFGNRYNTFGALHNEDTANIWYGPGTWRTSGDAWCYEYKPKDTGIMASPVIQIFE